MSELKSSKEAWIRNNFNHLYAIREICINRMTPHATNSEFLYTTEFFDELATLLYDNSTDEVNMFSNFDNNEQNDDYDDYMDNK